MIDDKKYYVAGDAYLSDRLFDGRWSNITDGQSYISEYNVPAIDEDGNDVIIVYHFDEIRGQEHEGLYDWDNHENIIKIETI